MLKASPFLSSLGLAIVLGAVVPQWVAAAEPICASRLDREFEPFQKMNLEISLEGVPKSQWHALAQQEIKGLGMVAIEGGIPHAIVRNQRRGEDCWAYTQAGLIETYVLNKTGVQIKLSPEYNAFWHIADQLEKHLTVLQKLVVELQANPKDKVLLAKIKKLLDSYGSQVRKHFLVESKDGQNIFVPDVGSMAPMAMREMQKYGVVHYWNFRAPFKTDIQETEYESAINRVVGKILMDAVHNKTPLDHYKSNPDGSTSSALFQLLKTELGPIMGMTPILPTDAWMEDDKPMNALGMLDQVRNLGLDMRKDLKAFTSTKDTIDLSLRAIATSLLQEGLPIPIGIGIISDKVNSQGVTLDEYTETTGLFTVSPCKGPCTQQDGGHEIKVVNFIVKAADGKPISQSLSKKEMAKMINNGSLIVTGLIIQNSWGPLAGVDVNGRTPTDPKDAGYYVITADYLANLALKPLNDAFDFVLPASVAAAYPQLQHEP